MTIKAINKTHQSAINKAYIVLRKYHKSVNLDGAFSTEAGENANAKIQAKHFDKYISIMSELPAREVQNFDTQHKTIHGYD